MKKEEKTGCGKLIFRAFVYYFAFCFLFALICGFVYFIIGSIISDETTAKTISVIIALVIIVLIILKVIIKKRTIKSTIYDIDNMDGAEFENFTAKLLKSIGHRHVRVTPQSNDYGIDVLSERNHIRYATQCKRYSHKVNNSAVQEAVAGKNYYGCDRAIVVTNNYFTENATELAQANNVILLDRDDLIYLINSTKNKKPYKKLFKTKRTGSPDTATNIDCKNSDNSEMNDFNNQDDSSDKIYNISEITGRPYLITIYERLYSIENLSDIEKMPYCEDSFELFGKEYTLNDYLTECAKAYSEKGYTEISEALNNKVSENTIIAKNKASKKNEDKKDQKEYISELIDKTIPFGAILEKIPDDIKETLFQAGAIKPTAEPLYPEYSFTEKEWENCEKNTDKLFEMLKRQNVWYNKTLKDIDKYSEKDFINYIKDLLTGLHYENIDIIEDTSGVDITCSKEEINYAVKCQISKSQKISVKPVRNISIGKNHYHCQVGIVITNGYYTSTAIDMANANSIILWDRDKLQNIINGQI